MKFYLVAGGWCSVRSQQTVWNFLLSSLLLCFLNLNSLQLWDKKNTQMNRGRTENVSLISRLQTTFNLWWFQVHLVTCSAFLGSANKFEFLDMGYVSTASSTVSIRLQKIWLETEWHNESGRSEQMQEHVTDVCDEGALIWVDWYKTSLKVNVLKAARSCPACQISRFCHKVCFGIKRRRSGV